MSLKFNDHMTGNAVNDLYVVELSEFFKDQLYFMVLCDSDSTAISTLGEWKLSQNVTDVYYFNAERELMNCSFNSDVDVLNFKVIQKYICLLREKLKTFKKVVQCTNRRNETARFNSAFLICAYMIIEENWTSSQVYIALSVNYKYKYVIQRNVSYTLDSYVIPLDEAINTLYKALWFGFLELYDFDSNEYLNYKTIKCSNIKWIVPETLMIFSSIQSPDYIDKPGHPIHFPANYYKYFKDNNVKHVIRLNSKKTYGAKHTSKAADSIKHTDLAFIEGEPPTQIIVQEFLGLCERYINGSSQVDYTNNLKCNGAFPTMINEGIGATSRGAMAVYLKAGLNRTSFNLIASYIMKHWPFTAVEAIVWICLCCPYTVTSQQKEWLQDNEQYLKSVGDQWRVKNKLPINKYKRFTSYVYSKRLTVANSYVYVKPPPKSHFVGEHPVDYVTSDDENTDYLENEGEGKYSRITKQKMKNVSRRKKMMKSLTSKNKPTCSNDTRDSMTANRHITYNKTRRNQAVNSHVQNILSNTTIITRSKASFVINDIDKEVTVNRIVTRSTKISTELITKMKPYSYIKVKK